MEPQKCGTLGNLNFMWKLCGPWREPGSRFRAAATPKLYWKNPKLFKLLGKNEPSFFKGHSAPEISTIPDFFRFRLPPQVRWNLYVESCGTSTFYSGTYRWNLGKHTFFKSGTSTFNSGTIYAEPRGTWSKVQSTPKLYWKNPEFSSCWGKQSCENGPQPIAYSGTSPKHLEKTWKIFDSKSFVSKQNGYNLPRRVNAFRLGPIGCPSAMSCKFSLAFLWFFWLPDFFEEKNKRAGSDSMITSSASPWDFYQRHADQRSTVFHTTAAGHQHQILMSLKQKMTCALQNAIHFIKIEHITACGAPQA